MSDLPSRRRHAFAPLIWALLALSGCDVTPPEIGARRDFSTFRSQVYPVLLRDCAFSTCHGAPERFFRVWGPGRSRLPGTTMTPDAFDLATGDEWSASYSLALSFIDASEPSASDLIRKPLALEAGGTSHGGVDAYGRNVYRTRRDTGFVALVSWVQRAAPYGLGHQP